MDGNLRPGRLSASVQAHWCRTGCNKYHALQAAEAAVGSVRGVVHAHARARWTGRTLRIEIEGWVDPGLATREADALGRQVADAVAEQLRESGSLTWAARAAQ